jgi:hypothetical protein
VDDFRVYVPVRDYRGGDPKKRARHRDDIRLAQRIEEHIQILYDAISAGGVRAIMAHSVAHALGEDSERVRRLMCAMQGGSNGVTYMKPDANGEYFTKA